MLRRLTFARAMHTLLIAAAVVVSLNPLYAQCSLAPQSAGAMVVFQSGDVSQLGDRAGYRLTIPPCGVVPQRHTIKTGADGYAKFQVSDGSTFEVFPNSEVTFRMTYGIGDLLNVWMGKVKVYIQHLPGIPNPNNVTTPTALISVRGTIFDVDVQDLDGTTFVTLDEGLVDVRHLLVASRIVRLNPGESVQVLPNTPLAALGRDKGMILRQVLRGLEDAVRQAVYQRPGSSGPGGTTSGPVGSAGGAQGDKGKNTGTTTGTGTGTGAPTGAPPAPPPPPPPPGGGA
ncbi:MAG: FecR family protein [Candidatus Solibacter sp.]|nr:FecR family protein [Candidatus Solibacter sp.]